MNITVSGTESTSTTVSAPPRVFIIALTLVSVWIVVVNALVLPFLVVYRHSLKNFVSLQVLSLSVTDTLVGVTAILLTTADKIVKSFPYSEPCAVILCGYGTAQTATLYHAFVICIHRLIILKRRAGFIETHRRYMYKTLFVQVSIPWIVSLTICSIPFLVFGRYGRTIQMCSLQTIFKDDYSRAMIILNINILTPQIGMNAVYIYMLVFLLRQWKRVNILRVRPEQLTTASGSHEHTLCEDVEKARNVKMSRLGADPPEGNRNCNDPRNKSNYFTNNGNRNNAISSLPVPCSSKNHGHVSRLTKIAVRNSAAMRSQKDSGTIAQKDVLITVGLILFCLNVFMSPFTFLAAIEIFIAGLKLVSQKVKLLIMVLALLNSALNPFIYMFRIKPLRDVLRGLVSKIYIKICRCHRTDRS